MSEARSPAAEPLTYEDYLVARVMAALERAYPDWRPAPGKRKPSELVKDYDLRRGAR